MYCQIPEKGKKMYFKEGSNIPNVLIGPECSWNIPFTCLFQAEREGHGIFHRLTCTLRTRRQKRMCGIPQQSDSALLTDPARKRGPVSQLPLIDTTSGRLLDNGLEQWIPALQGLNDILQITRRRPRSEVLYLTVGSVGQEPAALFPAFEGTE